MVKSSEYLTVAGVSELLGVSKSLVYRLLERGDLPYVQICGTKRISVESLRGFLEEHRR
jgi:excisionase family DNA binding protein